ncbi:hypothetical protein Y032_0157g3167 [Ancylostoma ceylanicum]|uniref:Uncharacterized protein n=1 Tax=Ancylostoma ceylanicum TaxID=53326 RepID=A0A016SY20_9BILA|nr:hypothetical protein Y032_0157g3167 [Ancylostoma ceylanicum]
MLELDTSHLTGLISADHFTLSFMSGMFERLTELLTWILPYQLLKGASDESPTIHKTLGSQNLHAVSAWVQLAYLRAKVPACCTKRSKVLGTWPSGVDSELFSHSV